MSDETDRRDRISDAHTTGVAAAHTLGEGLGRKADRGDVGKIVLVGCTLAVAVSVLIGVKATHDVVDLRSEQAAAESRQDAERERTRQAIASLQESNQELMKRGQQPVTQPAEPALGEALISAATARVLANMPAAPAPTDVQVSNAVAAYFLTNPVQVSPAAVASQVAAYLRANPPPPGPPGDKGDKGEKGDKGDQGDSGADGRTPTAEEIMAAFNQAAAANPDLLCAGKGKFTEVRGFIQVPPDTVPTERAFWVCLPQ